MIRKIVIRGMKSSNSISVVREALEVLEGVMSIEVNLNGQYALVDTIVTDDELVSAIEDIGYDVIQIN